MRRRLSVIIAIVFVLTAYAYFGSYGTFAFHSRPWDVPGGRPADAYYGSLAEGFLRGQLSLAHKPDPALMALPNPYDHAAREQIDYLWDASYLNGRYYLYFTPLPALLFYIPYRLSYTAYPSDQLAAAVFAAWAFLMAALTVLRALRGKTNVPVAIWIVMLGLGGVVPFIMVFSRTYEVATLCGMALSATWAWSLLRYVESPKTSRLVWMAIWLGLAIAARPNLGLLLPIAFLALPKPRLKPLLIALIPLGVIGLALLAYNYARFRNPLEFGHRYQLTYQQMSDHRVCGCANRAELVRLANHTSLYLFTPPFVGGDFPFAALRTQRLDPKASFNESSEEVGGLAPLIPIAALGTLAGIGLLISRRVVWTSLPPSDFERQAGMPTLHGDRPGLLILAAGYLALLGASACWYVTARYEVDFTLLITTGAVLCCERALTLLAAANVRVKPLAILAILLALYSALLGLALGFKGTGSSFQKENPELFQQLAERFS